MIVFRRRLVMLDPFHIFIKYYDFIFCLFLDVFLKTVIICNKKDLFEFKRSCLINLFPHFQ